MMKTKQTTAAEQAAPRTQEYLAVRQQEDQAVDELQQADLTQSDLQEQEHQGLLQRIVNFFRRLFRRLCELVCCGGQTRPKKDKTEKQKVGLLGSDGLESAEGGAAGTAEGAAKDDAQSKKGVGDAAAVQVAVVTTANEACSSPSKAKRSGNGAGDGEGGGVVPVAASGDGDYIAATVETGSADDGAPSESPRYHTATAITTTTATASKGRAPQPPSSKPGSESTVPPELSQVLEQAAKHSQAVPGDAKPEEFQVVERHVSQHPMPKAALLTAESVTSSKGITSGIDDAAVEEVVPPVESATAAPILNGLEKSGEEEEEEQEKGEENEKTEGEEKETEEKQEKEETEKKEEAGLLLDDGKDRFTEKNVFVADETGSQTTEAPRPQGWGEASPDPPPSHRPPRNHHEPGANDVFFGDSQGNTQVGDRPEGWGRPQEDPHKSVVEHEKSHHSVVPSTHDSSHMAVVASIIDPVHMAVVPCAYDAAHMSMVPSTHDPAHMEVVPSNHDPVHMAVVPSSPTAAGSSLADDLQSGTPPPSSSPLTHQPLQRQVSKEIAFDEEPDRFSFKSKIFVSTEQGETTEQDRPSEMGPGDPDMVRTRPPRSPTKDEPGSPRVFVADRQGSIEETVRNPFWGERAEKSQKSLVPFNKSSWAVVATPGPSQEAVVSSGNVVQSAVSGEGGAPSLVVNVQDKQLQFADLSSGEPAAEGSTPAELPQPAAEGSTPVELPQPAANGDGLVPRQPDANGESEQPYTNGNAPEMSLQPDAEGDTLQPDANKESEQPHTDGYAPKMPLQLDANGNTQEVLMQPDDNDFKQPHTNGDTQDVPMQPGDSHEAPVQSDASGEPSQSVDTQDVLGQSPPQPDANGDSHEALMQSDASGEPSQSVDTQDVVGESPPQPGPNEEASCGESSRIEERARVEWCDPKMNPFDGYGLLVDRINKARVPDTLQHRTPTPEREVILSDHVHGNYSFKRDF